MPKFRLLKASSSPPNADDCVVDDCIPPKEVCRPCCGGWVVIGDWGGGWGLGAVAYKERIDCFRSGRDIAVVPVGVDAALVGRSGGPPKKSNPPSNWDDVAGFVGGGLTAAELSVVLGLAGGAGISSPPIKSNIGAGFFAGGGGCCTGADDTRCEDDRSSFTFSWTMFRGCVERSASYSG